MLYVGAMNYSLLLTRSVDFDAYAAVLYPSYPDELARPLILSLIQMLWDRGEPNGYAWHMTGDPLPDTPRHKVLQLLSFGDHQVANVATEVQARTIGSRISPARRGSRAATPTGTPYFGMPPIKRFPYGGRRVPGGLGHRPAASAGLRRAPARPSASARRRRRSPIRRRASGSTRTTS